MLATRSFALILILSVTLVAGAATPRGAGDVPLNATYHITLAGKTHDGPFKLDGILVVVPCANPDAVYTGGEPHPLDLAIRTNASAIASGVRGTVYFFTNTRLTELIGGADHVTEAAANACSVDVEGRRVSIEISPDYARANPLNLMTLTSGFLAIGKQIVSGAIDLQFEDDGTVSGTVSLSSGRYASAGNVEYTATLEGRRRTR
jgi:hypothetical protein